MNSDKDDYSKRCLHLIRDAQITMRAIREIALHEEHLGDVGFLGAIIALLNRAEESYQEYGEVSR